MDSPGFYWIVFRKSLAKSVPMVTTVRETGYIFASLGPKPRIVQGIDRLSVPTWHERAVGFGKPSRTPRSCSLMLPTLRPSFR